MSKAYKPLRDDNPHAAPTELVGVLGNLSINMAPLRGSDHYHSVRCVRVLAITEVYGAKTTTLHH